MIPPSFIQELLARVDIVDVVGRSVQLKKAGANFLGLCPFHGEKSPSFTVSPTKQFYHCFGCGAHGTAISFMIEHSGLGFVDAVKELAQASGMKVPEVDRAEAAVMQRSRDVDLFELMARIAQFYKQRLRESNRAISYLKNRGLSGEIAARYAIGYAPEPWRGLEAAVADYQHESLVVTGMVIDSSAQAGAATVAMARSDGSSASINLAAENPTRQGRPEPDDRGTSRGSLASSDSRDLHFNPESMNSSGVSESFSAPPWELAGDPGEGDSLPDGETGESGGRSSEGEHGESGGRSTEGESQDLGEPERLGFNNAASKDIALIASASPAQSAVHAPVERKRRFDRFRDRIMFPIRNPRGQVIGFGGRVMDKSEPKYMNSPETPLFSKGRELYGLFEARQALRQTDCAIVVEGYMDVVMLAQYGVANAVATLGTATTPEHVQKLLRLVDRIVFAFDGDSAGRKAAWRALEACLPKTSDTKRIDFLFLPPEHDPDSYVREFGKEAFDGLLNNALPLSEFMIAELSGRSDVDTAEGRARLLSAARPLLLAMPPIALRLQLLHRLAELARIATGELHSFLQQGAERPGQPATRRGSNPVTSEQRSARVPMRSSLRPMNLFTKVRVLTALHPSLAKLEIEPGFLDDPVRNWLARIAKMPAGSSFAGLIELLRMENAELADQIANEVASAAALSECGIDEARQEFVSAIHKLREEGLEAEKKALAERGLASPDDRSRFQFLLTIRLVD